MLGSLGSFNVSNNTQLGLTFTYMATDNIGVELLAATPFRHKVGHRANRDYRHCPSAAAHPDGAVVLWRCAKQGAPVRGGAGINYTTFFNEDFNDTGKAAGLSGSEVPEGLLGRGGAGGRPSII